MACAWCGRDVWPGTETIDHICPRSKGGTAELENLLLACRRCNRRRGSRPIAAYLREQRERGEAAREGLIRERLEALAESGRRGHREYATRQLRHLPAVTAPGLEGPPDPA